MSPPFWDVLVEASQTMLGSHLLTRLALAPQKNLLFRILEPSRNQYSGTSKASVELETVVFVGWLFLLVCFPPRVPERSRRKQSLAAASSVRFVASVASSSVPRWGHVIYLCVVLLYIWVR